MSKDVELYERWQQARADGMTRKQFADSVGMTPKALDNRLYRGKKKTKRDVVVHSDKENSVEDIVDGNYRYLASKTNRIKTLPDLLEACKVDLEEWEVDDRYEVGSWEMGRRAEQKNIRWEGGKIVEGYAEDTGKLWIEALFRVRAVLVRKNPIPITPCIEPVRWNTTYKTKSKIRPKTGKALIVPDSQTGYRRDFRTGQLTPFHDRVAHDIVIQVADHDDFDSVVYLGDGLDFSEFSDKFVSEPEFYHTTQPSIIEFSWFLSSMRQAASRAKHDFILGNHEDRPDLMIRKHLRAAFQLKPSTQADLNIYSVPHILGLDDLGIGYADAYPNGEVWVGDNVRLVHTDGLSGVPGGTASKMVREISKTTLAGHNHRLEMATKTVDDVNGIRFVIAATCGCLCHLDYRVPGHKRGQHWQQGFATVYYDDDSPTVLLHPIINGEAIYNGKVFKGKDYASQVTRDTGWNFS